jgi:alanine racemase
MTAVSSPSAPTPAALTVDLAALARNYHALEAISGRQVHPVVKADAYGLGAARCAQRLMDEGARTFYVARAAGGVALRAALGPAPVIYVLDGAHGETIPALKASGLRPVINHPVQLSAWRAAGGGAFAIQIDTGMNRLGFRPEDAPEPFDGLELVISHLVCADEPAHPMNRIQRDAFAAVTGRYPGVARSLSNSGGCFLGPDFGFDAVRPGICLYGGGPQGRPDPRIVPVAALTAEVLQVRDVPAGETVGYSRGFQAEQPARIAVVSAGYADGVLRSSSATGQGRVWLNGRFHPIIGRVSMDVLAVDVTGGPDTAVGDRAELFGPNLALDDAAAAAGTISYELITSITPRVPRLYAG